MDATGPDVERHGWKSVWHCLAAELRTTPETLRATGVRVADEAPLPRPYFHPPDGLFEAFYHDHSLTVAAAPGFVGFARAWLHHAGEPGAALAPEGLRWLRDSLHRGGARLLATEQYVLLRPEQPPHADPSVHRVEPGEDARLAAEWGWSEDEAAAWIARGIYVATVGDRMATRVCRHVLHGGVAEIGVVTQPEFQRRGLATRAVAAAAADLLREHDAVLYTCALDDPASRGVAQHLQAVRVGQILYALDEGQAVLV